MSGILSAVAAPTIIQDKSKLSPKTKKTMGTISLATAAGIGAMEVSKRTFGKSYGWNTAINKYLKDFAKNSQKFFAKEPVKKVAEFIGKTTARQKLLGAIGIGALATIMAVREHYSKQEGAVNQKASDSKKVATLSKLYNQKIDLKDDKINRLEADNEIKDIEIKSLKQTIQDVEKAAENLGVDRAMEAELHKIAD